MVHCCAVAPSMSSLPWSNRPAHMSARIFLHLHTCAVIKIRTMHLPSRRGLPKLFYSRDGDQADAHRGTCRLCIKKYLHSRRLSPWAGAPCPLLRRRCSVQRSHPRRSQTYRRRKKSSHRSRHRIEWSPFRINGVTSAAGIRPLWKFPHDSDIL